MLREALIQKGLSNREIEVAELVSQGLANKEVADKLFVTEKTIKFHLTNIYKKMSVRSRAQLIVWCLPHLDFVTSNKANESNKSVVTTDKDTGATEIPIGNSTVSSITQMSFDQLKKNDLNT